MFVVGGCLGYQISPKKMGSFALGLWGDVVGYPASSLGSFTSKLADFHKFVKEILSPHLSGRSYQIIHHRRSGAVIKLLS